MMILKSSWRFLIVVLLASWKFDSVFSVDQNSQIVQQHVDQTDGVGPQQSSHFNEQLNKGKESSSRIMDNPMKLKESDQELLKSIRLLIEMRSISLTNQALDQRKAFAEFNHRKTFAVKSGSKITQRQLIDNLETTLPTRYKTLSESSGIGLTNLPITSYDERLFNQTQYLRSMINRINNKKSVIVFKNRGGHINGDVNFNINASGGGIKLISRSTDALNVDPSQLLDDLVYRQHNSRYQITGPIHLTKRSSVRKAVTKSTNGLNLVRDVVFKGLTRFQIKSPLRIRSLSSDLISTQLSSQLDDLIFINSKTPVTISSPLNFKSNIYIDRQLNVEKISNVHLQTFRLSVLTYNSDQIVPSPIRMRSFRVPNVQLKGQLNDINFNRVVRLLRTDLPIQVPKLIVDSNSLQAHDFSFNNLNNQRFPDDFLLANSPQSIPTPINFSNLKITRGAEIDGLINGLRYPDSFVTLNGNETINSNIIFTDSITFNRDVVPRDYIGKHRMVDLIDWTFGRSPVMKKIRNNPNGNVIVKGDLQVTSTINGIQLNGLLNDLVHRYDRNIIQITGIKTFINTIQVPSIAIREINRFPMKDFASSLTAIVSPLRFVNHLTINNLIWKSTGKSNPILDLIYKRISLVHEGTINGDIFIENMGIGSLQVDPLKGYRINNLSPRQLVFSGQKQHIRGSLTLTNMNFAGPILATKLLIGRSFNNRDVNRVMRNSLDQRKRSNVGFDRLILRNCRVNKLVPNSGDWRIRNRLLVQSLRNLLLKHGDQVISNRKRFLYQVSFGSNIKSRSSRGVLHGIQKGPLFRRSNYTIKQNLRLSSLVIQGNVQMNGKLNGIDFSTPLTDLQNNNQKSQYTMISSQSFYAGLIASKIHVNFINGKAFDKLWSKLKPPQFMVPVTIGDLIVNGQVYLNGLLNNLRIERVVNRIKNQLNQRAAIIHGDVIFKSPVNLRQNLNVSGTINSVDFGWLTRSLDTLSTIEKMTGVKTLRSMTIFGNLNVKRLNGQQLSDFLHNIVLIHPNKGLLIVSPIEFTSMTTIRDNINCDRLRSNFYSNVNGINIRNLLTNQEQQFKRSSTMATATIEFTDPVIIRSKYPIQIMGKVNNLNLQRDIIWLNDYFQPYQLITGHKSFKRAHFMSDVHVQSTLNGIDWTDRLRRIIHPQATQNITTGVKFAGKMIMNSGLFVSIIDDIPASSLIATNQPTRSLIKIPAEWTFNGPSLTVRDDLIVDGRIKNVSIKELAAYSLKKHVPQTINVPLQFDRIALKSMDQVNSMFNDLQSTQRLHSNRWNQVASRLNVLNETISSNSPIYSQLTKYIELTPIVIRGFQTVLNLPGIVGSTIDCHPIITTQKTSAYVINFGSLIDDRVVFTSLIFNGSQLVNLMRKPIVTPYIATHHLRLDQFNYNLYQASPNSTTPTILVNSDLQQTIGHLTGRAYDDLKILSIGGKGQFICALSSVRGVIETFTVDIVNGQPMIRLISTLNVTPSARKISLFIMMKEIYLAVARSSDSDCESEDSSSLLLHWIDNQFKLIQRFKHFEASNVVYYEFNGHSYLVFSESKAKVDRLTDKAIHVYQSIFKKWPYCQFKHFHSINFEHAIDLKVITVPSPSRSIQLLAALNSSALTIWQQKGNAGFTRIWSQSLTEGQSFKFITINSNIYLIVAQLSSRIGSFIMKAII
ncbi:uncharacterized protein LOC128396742 [Panonychus citri]|uniref:uncharacterized protein LOC128396742 n=1 Tax=Panonychus citri TaxID=50023 RepID=UPI002307B935|nr:uncharacterized protein LOC128396742 [Panonychus citri]